jgi:hypothetical protein
MKDQRYERTMQDMRQWNQGLIGKIYYELNPKNEKEFRTVRVGWNGTANKMVLQYSNAGAYITGTPPEGMSPMNPRLRSSIVTMQNNGYSSSY